MPITKFLRGNLLHAIGNRAVRNAVNGLSPHFSIGYDAANVSYSNVAALTADPGLTVDVIGGVQYLVYGQLTLALTAANNIKFDFNGSGATAPIVASSMIGRAFLGITGASGQETALSALNTLVDGGAATAWTSCEFWFMAQFQNSGQLTMEFAQHTQAVATTNVAGFIMAQPLDLVIESP